MSLSLSQGGFGRVAGGGYAGTVGVGSQGAPAKKKESGWSTWKVAHHLTPTHSYSRPYIPIYLQHTTPFGIHPL